jgi:hypothetical protein
MANEFRIKKGLIVNETDLYVSGSKTGIGTDTPSQTLTVAGNISGSGNLDIINTGAQIAVAQFRSSDTYAYINIGGATNNDSGIIFTEGGSADTATNRRYMIGYDASEDHLRFYQYYKGDGTTAVNASRMYLDGNGNLTVVGDLFVNDYARIDALRVGTTSTDPGDGNLYVEGDVTVGGKVTAQEFHTEFVSASIIYQSGSTKFGDTSDDVHSFSGSLRVTGSGDHYFTDGNVGIGTTSPGATLHLSDASNSGVTTFSANGRIKMRGDGVLSWGASANQGSLTWDTGYAIVKALSGQQLHLGGGNADSNIVIDTSGNVGIGTTSIDNKLHVQGGGMKLEESSGNIDFRLTLNGDNKYNIGYQASGDAWGVYHNPGSAYRIYVTGSNGDVGIGTSSPATKLEVLGSSNSNYLRLSGDDAAGARGLDFTSFTVNANAGAGHQINAKSIHGTLTFATSNTERMRIDTNGQVYFKSGTDFKIGLNDSAGTNQWWLKSYTNGDFAMHENGVGDKFTIQAGGNVGIGNTSPSSKLQIDNASGNTLALRKGTGTPAIAFGGTNANEAVALLEGISGGGFKFYIGSGTLASPTWSPKMVLDSSGSVGIGTTSPDEKLEVYQGNIKLGTATNTTSKLIFERSNANRAEIYVNSLNALQLDVASSERMRIDSSGNVGIGTTSPSAKLHVSGTVANNREFQVGNDYLVVTGSNGNVGIGTTSPSNTLHVSSSAAAIRISSIAGGANLYLDNLSGNNSRVRYNSSTGYFALRDDNASSDVFVVSGSNGNVGIGTTSPDQKLEVEGNIRLGTGGTIYGDTNNPSLTLNNSNGTFLRYTASHYIGIGAGVIRLVTGGSDRLYINSSGNVGIGTTSPANKLEVNDTQTTIPQFQIRETSSAYHRFGILKSGSFVHFVEPGNDGLSAAEYLMTINMNGNNVGIGTTSPEEDLHIEAASGGVLRLTDTAATAGGTIGKIQAATTAGTFFAGINFFLHDSDDGEIRFRQKVANTNTDTMTLVDGRVGIGTTSPYSKLSIEDGNIEFLTTTPATIKNRIKFSESAWGDESFFIEHDGSGAGAANLLKIYGDGAGGTAGGIVIARDGNVGIGTDSPSRKLSVNGVAGFGNGTIETIISFSDRGIFGTQSNHDLEIRTNGTERMRIDASGNVGIGTTSPENKLHIVDTSNPGNTSGSVIIEGRRDGTANLLTLRAKDASAPTSALPDGQGSVLRWQGFDGTDFENMGYILVNADGQAVANGDAPSYMAFGTSADGSSTPAERMRIDSSGNLTLGNSAYGSSLGQLRIINDASSNPASLSLFGYSNVVDNGNYAKIDFAMQTSGTGGNVVASIRGLADGTGENASDLVFYTATGGALNPQMTIDSSGNVGIGTTSPYYQVDNRFNNSDTSFSDGSSGNWGGNGIRVENTNTTAGTMASIQLRAGDADAHIAGIRQGTNDLDIGFFFEGSEKVRIDSSGNVGIGTASPLTKLHVTSADANTIFLLGNTGTGGVNWSMYSGNNSSPQAQSGGDLLFRNASSNVLVLQNDGDVLMPSGNVGIGTTSPLGELHVNDENATSTLVISRGGSNLAASTSIGEISFYGDYNSNPIIYAGITANSNDLGGLRSSINLNVKSTGGSQLTGLTVYGTNDGPRVGIGTTSPNTQLHIVNSGNGATSTIKLEDNAREMFLGRDQIKVTGLDGATSQNLYIQPAGDTAFATTSGNVGIGITSPGAKLDVNGKIRGDWAEFTTVNNTDPGSDDLNVSGYGILGNRTTNPVFLHNYGNGGIRISSNAALGTSNGMLVKDTAVTVEGSTTVGYTTFNSGFGGNGWRIDGNANAEFQNLTVRGTFSVYELLAQQIRATNGSLLVATSGKVDTSTGGSTGTLTFDTGNVYGHGFLANDIILAQRLDTGGTSLKRSFLRVDSRVDSGSLTYTVLNGDNPEAGQEFVRIGNTSNADRQGHIYLTADDSNAPYIGVRDGVSAYTDFTSGTGSVEKVRVGRLDGVTSANFGSLSGYGLWASGSVYLEGGVNATFGLIGGWTLNADSITGGDATLAPTGNLTLGQSNDVVRLSADDGTYRLWTGHATAGSAPFRVTKAGAVTATSATITGNITAETGYIGTAAAGFDINSSYFRKGTKTTYNGAGTGVYIGTDGIGLDDTFSVSSAGVLSATGVTISGDITANTGTIGGFTISSDALAGSNFYLSGSATGNEFFISSSNFNVKANGDVTGSSVLFNGGKIGGFDITSDKLSIVNGDFEILQGTLGSNNIGYRVVETAGGSRQINMRYDTADDSLEFLIYKDSNNYFNVGDAYANQYTGWGLNLRVDGEDILKVENETVTLSGFTATKDAFAGSNFYISGSATGNEFFISSSNFNVKANGDVTGSSVLFDGGKVASFNFDADRLSNTDGTFYFGNNLSSLSDNSDADHIFMGNWSDGSNPIFRINGDGGSTQNLLQYYPASGTNQFLLRAGGDDVLTVSSTGVATIAGFTFTSNALSGTNFYISGSATGNEFFISSSNFNVKANGDVTGSSVLFDGGTVGGFDITSTQINNSSGTNLILKANGQITASAAFIGGTSTIAGFTVSDTQISDNGGTDLILKSNGQITASAAQITGDITATSGTIGGWTAASTLSATNILLDPATPKITLGAKASLTDANTGAYIGTDGLALGASSVFKVTDAGVLTATSATITGAITATNITATTAGNIAGFTISSDQITASSGILNLKANGRITGSAVSFTGGRIAGFDFSSTAFQSREVDQNSRRVFQLYTGLGTTEAFISGAGDTSIGSTSIDAFGLFNDPYNYWQRVSQDFGITDTQYFRVGDGDEYIFYDNSTGFSVNLDGATLGTLTLDNLSAQGSEATALMINGSNVVGTRELQANAFTSTNIAVSSYTNATDNRVLTSTGAGGINGESSLTYNGTDLTITNGNVNVSSGYGIDFAATGQAAGMSSELLDDYEEGTWTPQWVSSDFDTVTMDVVNATYTKVGNLVTLCAYVRTDLVTLLGSPSAAYMTGVPFQPISNDYFAVNVGYSAGWPGDEPTGGYLLHTSGTGTRINFHYRTSANGTSTTLSSTDFGDPSGADANQLIFTITYHT